MTLRFKEFYVPAVSLFVQSPNLPFVEIQNLDGNGLRMDWSVTRDNTGDADQAEVTIYNMSRTLAGQLHAAWANRPFVAGFEAGISVGWQGVTELLLRGDVWDLRVNGRDGADNLTTFKIGDGHNPLRDSVQGRTFNGTKIDTCLRFLVELPQSAQDVGGGGLGLVYPKESKALVVEAANALPIRRWRNIPAGHSTRENVDILMDMLGLQWRVQNGAFVAMKGAIINRPGPLLRPDNGLLSYESRNDGGITVEALTNPDVEPGIQMQVQDNRGKAYAEAVYRVESISFTGSSIGASTMTIEGAKGTLA
jgi:hypothetical protein